MKNVEDIYPLTPLQKGMLFHTLLAPESGVYVSQLTCTLPADLDPGRFRQAWETLVRRHGVLRTAFLWEGLDEPLQAVRKTVSLPWQELDWRGLPEGEQERRFADLCHRDRHAPFSLARAPLLRFSLIHLGRQIGFVWTVHHLLLDGWSLPLLIRELALVYAALQEGREPALPPVRPFGDYIVWLRKQDLVGGEAFWREELSGFTAPTPLPLERRIDRPAGPAEPSGPSGHGDHRLAVSRETTAALQALAARHKLTLQTVTLGAWAVLLHRSSSAGDVVFGCVVSGRPDALPGVETMIGLFINTLPVRVRVCEAEPLASWLKRLQERQLARQGFEHCPLTEIQRWSEVPSGTPLFETLYVFENYPVAQAGGGAGGLHIANLKSIEPTNFPITLTLQGKDRISLRLTVDRTRLEEAAAPRLLQHLAMLLDGMAKEPEHRLGELSLLSAAERHQLLQEWSGTAASVPREAACLHELFEAQVRRTPEAVALLDLVDKTGGAQELSYRALDEAAERLAAHLRHCGAGPEVVVGVCLERSADLVVALLAILKAGAAYLPLDPELPRRRLEALLTNARPSLVVTGETLAAALPWRGGGRRARGPDPRNLAYVLFTSGSTGTPKGVAVTHGSAVELVRWAGTVYAPDELAGVLASTALSFDLSVFELFVPLSWGGTVILARNVLELPDLLASGPAAGRVTLVNTVPSALAELVHGGSLGASIRTVNLAGEPLPRALADRIYATGTVERVWNLYGPSEDTTYSTFARVARESPAAPAIGRPVTATQAYVLAAGAAPEPLPVPVGVAGELYLGGAGLARGYLHRPDLTAERFLPDPFAAEPGARLYRTGDLVRWEAAGELAFLGRLDHQVKVRGFRIEPGEIEAALAGLPGVREAVVVARAASDDRRLVAYVVGDAAPGVLRQALRERLPEHMVPAAFVTLAALPRTPNGKVDRKALLSPGAAPEQTSAGENRRAPRTPVEEVLAGIWAELLGIDRIGPADHFFDLGGHSLLATRVTSRLRSALGVEIPLRDLFAAPTLADLAARVEAALRAGAGRTAPSLSPLAPALREGPLPLSFAQQRLWFIDQLEPGSPLYNMPAALRIEGPLDPGVLARTLGEIARRHEALRTVFAMRDGAPVQVIQPAVPFILPLVDLTGLPDLSDLKVRQAFALAAEEAVRPFDLARGPLWRGVLLRLAEGDHVVALTLHHIAADGWSIGILVREVAALYAAFAAGRPSPLPELPVQYADFAVWQSSWLQGEILESEISFWRRQLAGLPPHLSLPTDRPRPAVQSFRGAIRPVGLPPELARQAQVLGRRERATLFMVLLAGFQALLARHSGQDDLAVGSPVAGRNRVEIEGLVGFFVNTLVLRGDLWGRPTFRELLGRVRETALAAYLHQDVPFEKLVEELAPERSFTHTPLFQVMLALQNAPVESLEIRDLHLRPVSGTGTTAKFDLEISLQEHDGGLSGTVEYATDLFDAATIDRLILHFERLLTAAVEAPERIASELPLLSPPERHQALIEWNDSRVELSRGALLDDLFAAQAAGTPDAPAAVFEGETLTYAGLDARADRLARRLRRLGCGPERRVGVALERTLDLLVALLGVLRAGAVYVPLDPQYPRERLAFLLESSRPAALLTQESLRDRLPVPAGLPVVMPAALPETDGATGRATRENPGDDCLAYIIYTSGSTGRPKGAMVTHAGMINHLWAKVADLGLDRHSRVAQTASPSFDISIWQLLAPLLAGGSVQIASEPTVQDPELLLRFVARERITVLEVVPSLLSGMLGSLAAADGSLDLSCLQWLIVTGEACAPDLANRWLELAPHTRLLNAYGPTECSDDVTHHRMSRPEPRPSLALPVGRPVANTRIYVLDAGQRPVAPGVAGELCVAGRGVGRGYLGLPARTAEVFVPDAWSGTRGSRLYRTGDLARWLPEGILEFLGRLDHQVKVRGFRIELGEIEAALAALAGVREAAVVVHDQRLVAYVAGDAAAEELRLALRERLPDYMVPAAFVKLPALPLTPNGKLDRKALPAPEWQSSGETSLRPRTPVAEVLAGIWAEVLGRERVGPADHFFDLGGHSLLATQVMSRLRRALGIEMPLRDLFEAPALADFAARAEAALRAGADRLAPPPVPVAPTLREGPLPLSFAQQRLWFIDQLEPGSPLYNVPVALRIEGPLDRAVLERCLGETVRRHEALRTVFAVRDGAPVQVILPAAPFALPVVDLAGLPERRCEAQARALAAEEAARPFDLARDPMLRGILLRHAGDDHVLALTMHHIASDGWSMGILIREVAALYPAFAAGRPSPLPELPVQSADFAVWQQSWLRGEVLEGEISFWRRELAGLPPLLELPTDRPRPAVQSYRGAWQPVRLPAGLSRRAEALGRREGTTLFMVLLAIFQALLARTSGQQDLAVGSPIAGRNRVEIEGLIGFFVNTLVLRGNLTAQPTFHDLLGRVRETALAAYLHQDLPFEKLVEELAPERSLAHAPLFQVMLVLQNAPGEALEIRDLRLRPMDVEGTTAKFDLTLILMEHDGGLVGMVEHATDLFDATTIARWIEHFERLLEAALAEPERPIAELPLLSEAEHHQLRLAWNDTGAGGASGCVHELFERQARRTPDAVAVVFGSQALTYGALAVRAGRLARHLRRLGVGPDALAGLLVERSLDMILGVLGILQAGGAYVPLDPGYPAERLAFMLSDTRSPVLLTQRSLLDRVPAGNARVVLLDGLDETAPETVTAAPPDESLAYVIYTSGSTGRPKGVALSHRALRNLIDWHLATLLGGVPTLQFASLSFDASFHEMFACWGSGGTLIVVPEELRRDIPALPALLVEQRIEKAIFPVVVLQQLAEICAERRELPPLREITTTGERLQTSRAMAALLRRLPGCAFHNHYGPSETHVATAFTLSSDPGDWAVDPSIGRPIWNSTAHVLAPGLVPAPAGVPGDLYLGGACVARGYLGRPDLTAERFVPDPFAAGPGSRLYRTGDKVRLSVCGELEYLGRFDDQVKIRGFRVEPREIEEALLALPGVHEAVVLARSDRSDGSVGSSGDRRLVAYVVGEATPEALRRSLRERLPDYMVPAAFVILSALPLTPNGKVDRKALPAPERQSAAESYVAPRTPVEEVLAGIWAELLGLERVGIADHFFELGGHSLLATRVVSRVRSAFGIDMPLRELFEAPTLADLAARIEVARRAGQGQLIPPLVPVPREGPLPLSFAQQRLWFIDQLAPASPLYNLPVALRIEGPLDIGVLALTLGEIVRRHEVLRTVFAVKEGSPVQVIRPAAPFPVAVADLVGLPEREREALALPLVREEAGRPFDLTRGPLLRGLLLRMAEGDHVAVLTQHHIASDGWSMGILVREVAAIYPAFAAGRPSPLPELPIQYADFAAWQSSWLQGEILENEISFWRRQLADLPPLLTLPTDRPRPAVQSFRGASRPVRLPAELAHQAQALARREGATLFMVLLAAFQTLLARFSGQDDLAVGAPVAGRNRVEIEGLIGFFVNTLVLRGDLTGGPSFRELLGRTRETALEAHTHQDVPFEKLVEELSPERSLAHAPLVQVMLVLQNLPEESLEIAGLCLRPFADAGTTAKLDLTLALVEQGGELIGSVEHSTELFDRVTIERLVHAYELLLRAIAAAPEPCVLELPLFGEGERHQLLVEWSRSPRLGEGALPGEVMIHQLFERQAESTPEAMAVVLAEERWSYGELNRRANRLARSLRRLGVGPEVRVAVLLKSPLEIVTGLLGILKAGGAYVPLDPAYPADRLAFMIADAGVEVLLTEERFSGASGLRLLRTDTERDTISAAPGDNLPSPADAGSLAYVMYTSGSTGVPKGVPITHENLVPLLLWSREVLGFGEHTRVLQSLSSTFDYGVFEVLTTLLSGGTLFLRRGAERSDIESYLQEVRRHAVNTLQTTPSLFHAVAAAAAAAGERLSTLEVLLFGGEALGEGLVEEAFAIAGEGCRVFNGYGPTETAVCCALFEVGRKADWHPRGSASVPIGRPTAANRIHVLDPRLLPVPVGALGELMVGGVGLSRGYLGRPDLTAARFIPDPFGDPGGRLYRTGDLVRFHKDGALEFLGRLDHQVKIRGFRIEPGEIEAVLASLPGIRETVVAVRDQRLIAYVVGDAAPDALRQALRERLPDSMVPATFVTLDSLPLTPNGKVDRKALPAPAWQRTAESCLAPRTPVEEILAGIWAELLGVERIGVDDDFFALGGHSLLGVRLMARIERVFGVKLPVAALFEAPTLERLAGVIQRGEASARRSPLVRLHPGGASRPLFVVHPVGGDVFAYVELARRLGAERPVYGLQAVAAGNGHSLTMEELAAQYLAAVREVQAEGPYLLAGWSLGAVIAYEMAQQIERSGGSVALLAMIDPSSPQDGRSEGSDEISLLAGFAADLVRLSGRQVTFGQEVLEGLGVDAALDRLFDLGRREGVLPPDLDKPRLRERFDLFSRHLKALQSYVARPYGGRVTLFRAAASLPPGEADPALGWSALARARAHLLDADHYSLLQRPVLDRLVEHLQSDLAAVEEE